MAKCDVYAVFTSKLLERFLKHPVDLKHPIAPDFCRLNFYLSEKNAEKNASKKDGDQVLKFGILDLQNNCESFVINK